MFAVLAACSRPAPAVVPSDVTLAEQALAEGRYARAQHIADTLVVGSSFSDLNVEELCRLAMVFMELGENAEDPGVTVASATRCLGAAFERDSDSTAACIRDMDSEDRARAMVVNALIEAASRTASPDSLIIPPDSIPDNEL